MNIPKQISLLFVFITFFFISIANASDSKFFFAAKFDDVESIQSFIDSGINPNVGDVERGETALMWSIRESSHRVFDYLIQHPQVNINHIARNGDSALMLASYLQKTDYVVQLLNAKANVNQQGWSALHYAAVVGNLEIVELLIEHNAQVNALSPNATTPLMMATRSGNLKLIKFLIKHGADAKLKNEQNMTAYDFAVQDEMKGIIEYLSIESK